MSTAKRKPATDSEVFNYLYLRFDIVKALGLVENAEVVQVKADAGWTWMVHVDKEHAQNVDVERPVLFARMILDNAVVHILIDGHHRNYKACTTDVELLKAKILTVEETFQVLTVARGMEKKLRELKRDARKLGYGVK